MFECINIVFSLKAISLNSEKEILDYFFDYNFSNKKRKKFKSNQMKK